MYFKLALRNVRKSYKDYMIYFLTLAFSVCLFYTFNSFQEQQAVVEMNSAQFSLMSGVTSIMAALSVIVAFILGFLILYANNFLIKRRKKELGIYTLLGMPRKHISMILVYETFIIGLVSLAIGLILGIFLSQLLTVFTASLFETTLNYHFIFSIEATIFTVLSFALIFFIVMIFNTFILNKYKLIDLINAERQNEKLKVKNIYISVILFVLSLLLLGCDYWYSWNYPLEAFGVLILPVIIVGCIGTLLFFMSLSGFLLKFIQTSKSLYFKKLNMFVLRQINANINSNFVSMSVVCVMLLLSIGALATGMNLNKTLNNSIRMSTPYDYSYMTNYNENFEETSDIEKAVQEMNIDTSYIKEQLFLHQYYDGSKLTEAIDQVEANNMMIPQKTIAATPITTVRLSDFNKLMSKYDVEPIQLQDNEMFVYSNQNMVEDELHDFLKSGKTLDLFGKTFHPVNTDYGDYTLGTTVFVGNDIMVCVINDDLIPTDATILNTYWNVDLNENIDSLEFLNYIETKITEYNETIDESQFIFGVAETSDGVRENSKGLSVIFTYVGIYLGIVFLIASAVILALQQLSQANDNRKRYQILDKIGVSPSMMNHSVLEQLGIYFFMPLVLAIIHSIVGIRVVNSIVMFMGSGDIFGASIITGGIIILIYGAYFLITYIGYNNILHQK